MNNLKSLIFIILFFFSNVSAGYTIEKIVFFDLDYVVSKSKAGNNISTKLKKLNEKNVELLDKEQKKLKKELDEIKKVQNIVDKKELEKKIKIHNENVKKFNIKKKELSNQLIELRKKEIVQLVNKINPILESYMNTNSIDFILSKQGVYLSKTTYDITQEILEIVNKKVK